MAKIKSSLPQPYEIRYYNRPKPKRKNQMTLSEIKNTRSKINFIRSEVVYLLNSGNEKKQGLEYTKQLGRISERLETKLEAKYSEDLKKLYDWAYSNWKMAKDKFQ